MYDLSIIIVNFNTKKLVIDCVNSILTEGSKLKLEIIIVDNGSKERLEFSENVSDKVKVILNRENTGFSKACNQGIKIAQGKYIFLLNSDTIIKKGTFSKLIKFAENEKNAGVVAPKLLNRDGSLQDSVFVFPSIIGAIKRYWFGNKSAFGSLVPNFTKPEVVDAVVGAAFLMTPVALKKVGILDERYFFYSEDLDYCRRVKNTGLKVYYYPDAEVFHYKGESGKAITDNSNQWRRQIPSSKIYNGIVKHYILFWILKIGQKLFRHN